MPAAALAATAAVISTARRFSAAPSCVSRSLFGLLIMFMVQSCDDEGSGAGHIDVAGRAPIARRDLVDQHIGRRVRRPFFDADDDVVNPLDDLAPLLRRENALWHIDFGNRHVSLLLSLTIPRDVMPSITMCQVAPLDRAANWAPDAFREMMMSPFPLFFHHRETLHANPSRQWIRHGLSRSRARKTSGTTAGLRARHARRFPHLVGGDGAAVEKTSRDLGQPAALLSRALGRRR